MGSPRFLFLPAQALGLPAATASLVPVQAAAPAAEVPGTASALLAAPPLTGTLTGTLSGTTAPAGGVAWRLVGGNNRELGRARSAWTGLLEAQAAVRDLQHRFAEAEDRPVPGASRWGWEVLLDDVVVGGCSRWYARQREARYSWQQFAVAVPGAVLAGTVAQRSRREELQRDLLREAVRRTTGTALRAAP